MARTEFLILQPAQLVAADDSVNVKEDDAHKNGPRAPSVLPMSVASERRVTFLMNQLANRDDVKLQQSLEKRYMLLKSPEVVDEVLTIDKWFVSRRVLNSFSYSGPLIRKVRI